MVLNAFYVNSITGINGTEFTATVKLICNSNKIVSESSRKRIRMRNSCGLSNEIIYEEDIMNFVIDERKLYLACANECMSVLESFKKAGCSSVTMQRIHKGKPIQPKTLGKLARALNVRPIDLLKEEIYCAVQH